MSASNPKIHGVEMRTMCTSLKTTFRTQFDASTKLQLGGKSRTVGSVIGDLDAAESHYADVEKAHLAVRKLIDKREAATPDRATLIKDAIATLVVHFGGDEEKLAAAGIPPKKKKRQLTAEEQYAASIKRNRTRTMRGTMGSRQKQQVRAEGKVVVGALDSPAAPSPSKAAAAKAPSASPAPAPASAVNQAVPTANGANPVAGS